MATAFFKLVRSSTYDWRSKASGKLYTFVGNTVIRVDHPGDQERFRRMPEQLVETDERGNVLHRPASSGIPMAFSRHGMVPPKSYTKLSKEPPASPPARTSAKPQVAPVSRTVVSSKKAAEPPAPVPSAATVTAPALNKIPTGAPPVVEDAVASDAEKQTSEVAADSTTGVENASPDGEPKKRTKRSSRKKSGRIGDQQ